MMTSLTAAKARQNFSEIINKVAFGKDRVLLTRHGKGLAAVVSMEDLQLLSELEDRMDVRDAKIELSKPAKGNRIPWESIRPSKKPKAR